MKKFLVGILTSLAVIGLVAIPTPKANAGWPGGYVGNVSGYSVTVRMDGGAAYTEWEGMNSYLWGRDANQFRLNRDWRCVEVNSAWYKALPGNFFKVGNFQKVNVRAYTYNWCGTKNWLSTRLERV